MLDADAVMNNYSSQKWVGPMPIRTQLLKKWVGPDPEKHIGSTPLLATTPLKDETHSLNVSDSKSVFLVILR